MAKTIMNDITNAAQTNGGMRFKAMPGARNRRIVTINSTAAVSADTSIKVIMVVQISTP